MNKIVIIFLFLSGCNHVVPVTAKFPDAPDSLLVPPPKLITLPSDNRSLSDLLDNANKNYGTYYEIREKLLLWQEWFKAQKEIFDNVKE